MSSVWEEFRNGGWMNWPILLLGMVGVLMAFAAFGLALTKSRAALTMGAVAALLGAFIAGLGLLGMWNSRRMVDAAVSGEGIRKSMIQRIRRVGYEESRSCVKFGIGFAALPILAGTAAMLVGATRRRPDDKDSAPWTAAPASSGAPPSPPPPPEGASIAFPAAVISVAGLLIAASFVALTRPLPGAAAGGEDKNADLIAAKESIEAGDLADGCDDLEDALRGDLYGASEQAPDTSKVPGFEKLCEACVDWKLKKALTGPPEGRVTALSLLKRSKLPKTKDQRKRIEDALLGDAAAGFPEAERPADSGALGTPGSDSAPGAGDDAESTGDANGSAKPGDPAKTSLASPKVAQGSTQVSGRLPPEVIRRIVRQNFGRIRLCYENGLLSNPDLKGRMTVRFVIGRDGGVSNVTSAGSDLPDSGVVACVARSFSSLSFPQPEGGIVTVNYPLTFTPG